MSSPPRHGQLTHKLSLDINRQHDVHCSLRQSILMFLLCSTHALAELCESCIARATQSYLCHLLRFVCSCLLGSSSELDLAHTCSRKGLLGLKLPVLSAASRKQPTTLTSLCLKRDGQLVGLCLLLRSCRGALRWSWLESPE